MLRFIAKWWAKRQYIWKLEVEAGTNEINAALAAKRANEKRELIEQLNKEADDIEANIKREEESEEYKALQGQEKYDADREKRDAEKIIKSKRQQAKAESENVTGGEQTAQHFRNQAQNGHIVADKIRQL